MSKFTNTLGNLTFLIGIGIFTFTGLIFHHTDPSYLILNLIGIKGAILGIWIKTMENK